MAWPVGCYRVAGNSMLPRFQPGDIVLAWRWGRCRPGQVVVVKTPERLIIKRLAKITTDGLWLSGDNPAASTDSRQHGNYPDAWLVGRVITKLSAP